MSACGLERDVRRLRGSHLSADERVFAAMLWQCERWRAQLAELHAGYRLAASRHLPAVVEALRPRMAETQRTVRKLASLWAPSGGVLAAAGLGEQLRSRLAGVAALQAPRVKLDVARLAPLLPVRRSVVLPSVSQLVAEHVFSRQRDWAPVVARLRELVTDPSADAFVRRWEHSSLWFIFSLLTLGAVRPFAELDNEQVEASVLDALEAAAADAQFAADRARNPKRPIRSGRRNSAPPKPMRPPSSPTVRSILSGGARRGA